MIDILKKLIKTKFQDSEKSNLESSFSDFVNYYNENPRHRYSEISKYIYSLDDEEIDILSINLHMLMKLADEKGKLHIAEKLDKLIDHADLAHHQRKYFEEELNENNSKVEGYQELLRRTGMELAHTRNEIEKKSKKITDDFENHQSRIYSQFVTVLGIFTTIIFAAFGGLEMLRNILGNINDVNTEKLLVFSSLTLSGIIILLFILLSGISKLTRLNLRSCGCNSKDTKCEHNFAQKYPAFVLAQLVLFIIFLLGLTGYFIPYRTLFTEFITDKSVGVNSIIFGVLLFNLAVFASFYYFYKKQPKEKKHKNASNSKASQ